MYSFLLLLDSMSLELVSSWPLVGGLELPIAEKLERIEAKIDSLIAT